MRILATGGGSGGHFYPIIAVIEELNRLKEEKKFLSLEVFYMSDTPYNREMLFDHNVIFLQNSAGKLRRYFSFLNLLDMFKTAWGMFTALWKVFQIYPDIVFGKGGYASFPALFAARILRIPVVIHESDAIPGVVNKWAGKFATRIAVSYPEAVQYFPEGKTAYTGNPVRENIRQADRDHKFFNLDPNTPTVLILGGSLGSQLINEIVVDGLPQILGRYQVIHQTGKANIEEVRARAEVVTQGKNLSNRYVTLGYCDDETMRKAAGVADVVISRAGSTIFEIAGWGKPSILIPISKTNGDHQRKNAYAYARTGGCIVIEEMNLTANILFAEIKQILDNRETANKMRIAADSFIRQDAAQAIAEEIVRISISHER